MAKKQMSFAEKSAKHKSHKDWKTVKYIKSERSAKTGNWRFNESYVQLAANENLDQALKRMDEEVKALTKKMATIDEETKEVDKKSKVKPEVIDEEADIKMEKPEKATSAENEVQVYVKAKSKVSTPIKDSKITGDESQPASKT